MFEFHTIKASSFRPRQPAACGNKTFHAALCRRLKRLRSGSPCTGMPKCLGRVGNSVGSCNQLPSRRIEKSYLRGRLPARRECGLSRVLTDACAGLVRTQRNLSGQGSFGGTTIGLLPVNVLRNSTISGISEKIRPESASLSSARPFRPVAGMPRAGEGTDPFSRASDNPKRHCNLGCRCWSPRKCVSPRPVNGYHRASSSIRFACRDRFVQFSTELVCETDSDRSLSS